MIAGASALRAGIDKELRQIQVQASVAQASGVAHVRNATLRFEFPSPLVGSSQTPTILSGAGWALSTKGTSGGVTYFEYLASGDVNQSTAVLSVRVVTTVTSDFTPNVTFRSTAQPPLTSVVPVPPVSLSVAGGVASNLVVDGSLNAYNSGSRLFLQRGQFRWDGPYNQPVGPAISSLRSTVTIPKTLVGTLTASDVQITAGATMWTLQSVTDNGSAFVLLFTSSATLSQQSSTASALEISFVRKTPPQAGTVAWTGTGVCSGVTIPAAFTNPATIAVPATSN